MTTTILSNGLQVRVAPCINCRRLLPVISKNRCRACYTFFYRHGYDRSPDSVQAGITRRHCDCGQVARHEKTIQIGKDPHFKTTTLYLCDDCLKLEQQK